MKDIGYVLRRLLDMNYKAMFQKLGTLHRKTGKSYLYLLRDMQKCAVNYGAGYMDYDLFEMYDLTDAQRDTYLTRGRNNALIKKYNDLSYAHFFDNKDEFNANFGPFIRREWAKVTGDNDQQILDFLQKYPVFICKPIVGSCGKGVEKLAVADYASPAACLEYLKSIEGACLVEAVIQQHSALSAIYPDAINTVRAVTIIKDGTVHLISTCFRIGNGGKHVDNFNSGGMVVPVDEKTGTISMRACDKNKNVYAVHPQTGVAIQGFTFPDWDKMIQLVDSAARVVPQMAYLGWDVAFTPDGPCLVEGNNFPGHDLYQIPEHNPEKLGYMPRYNI